MTTAKSELINQLNSVEKVLMSFPKGIPNWENFKSWADTEQLTNRHRGTWYKPETGPYTYIKQCWEVDNYRRGQKSLSLLNMIKDRNGLHPNTQFRLIFNQESRFQLVAVMPKLEQFDHSKNGKDGRQIIATNIKERDAYSHVFDDTSHVLEWVRRIIPTFDPANESPEPIWSFLSDCITEGSYPDNWGWDPKTGIIYPVDVEIISLNNEFYQPEKIKMQNYLKSLPTP